MSARLLPAARPVDTTVPWTPAERGQRLLAPFTSSYVGVVHRLFEQLHDVDDLHVAGVGGQACDARPLLGTSCNELNGGGAPDVSQARAAAVGETVERYSAAWLDPSDVRTASPDELAAEGVDHVRPDELELFSAAQLTDPALPYVAFAGTTPVAWVAGQDLTSGRPALLPARLVHLRHAYPDDASPIGYATSNGLACGCTWEEAVLGGALELAERDAFTTTWYGRLSLPRLDPRSDPALARWWDRHVAPTRLSVALVDLSILVDLPVVLAVVRNDATPVAPVALGAACAPTLRRAAEKAVVEAFQTRTWAKAEQREGAVLDPADGFGAVQSFDDHVRMSLHPDAVRSTRFLDAAPDLVPLDESRDLPAATPGQALEQLLARLSRQGVRLLARDVTSPDVAEGGLVVAKVLSPQLHPLDAGYTTRHLGGRRLLDRPAQVGLLPAPLELPELNPWPHPFP